MNTPKVLVSPLEVPLGTGETEMQLKWWAKKARGMGAQKCL